MAILFGLLPELLTTFSFGFIPDEPGAAVIAVAPYRK